MRHNRQNPIRLKFILPLAVLMATSLALVAENASAAGKLKLTVVDDTTGELLPCRMHLKNQAGRAVKPPRVPYWQDHFVFDGTIELKLPNGGYTFEIEHGPEYVNRTGNFVINNFADDSHEVTLKRFVNMADEGWYGGDMHIHRPLRDIELLMRAEALHVGPVITWWNDKNEWKGKSLPEETVVMFDKNRYYDQMAGEDEHGGGAVLFFRLKQPLDLAGSAREFPTALPFVREAQQQGGWVDAEKPFWWDVPLWLSNGEIDSIGLANNHMQRDKMYEGEAWGKPRNEKILPAPHGNGQWSTQIYYNLLEAGLQIPPSAGSASGVLDNPVGYNRVYVHVDGEFTYDAWWENFRKGRVVVTNGPLLRTQIGDALPGHTFIGDPGRTMTLKIGASLATRDPISYFEVIKNGRVVQSVRLDDWAKNGGVLPDLEFEESGWFLVRAVTDVEKTYRFASTGPYYVEFGGQPRISKEATEFFLNWAKERRDMIKLTDPAQREQVLEEHERAIKFWEARLEKANSE